jgi:hypothetical protein
MANDQEATPQSRKLTKGPSGHYAEHLSTHVRDPKDCPTCKCIEAQMDEATPQSVEPLIVSVVVECGGRRHRVIDNLREFLANTGSQDRVMSESIIGRKVLDLARKVEAGRE